MKKKNIMWIILPVAGILIVAVIVTAVLLISLQNKEERYHEQMRAAEMYMEGMDYSEMVSAYEAAIELRPQDPDAYLALAEYYYDEGQYYNAISITTKGYEVTGSKRLKNMLELIETTRQNQEATINVQQNSLIVEGDDSPKLLIRNNMIGNIGEYCYQQYVNEYGDASVKYVSEEEGYRAKFNNLSAYAYFDSTSIDKTTKKPLPNAKPYKVMIQTPQLLFYGYEGYISSEKIAEIFDIQPESVLEQYDNGYYLVFEYLDCQIKIAADAAGNVYGDNPEFIVLPLNPVSDWVEEEVVLEEEEEDEEDDTFVLGGQEYTYDVTEIILYGEKLDDLSPLANCKKLNYIGFTNCEIADLSPISGCSALEELNLQYSYGNMELSCLVGLEKLKYLGFHECKDIDDITCIYGLELKILHPCASSVPKSQCLEYQTLHPDCEVWFDYYYPIP